MGYARFIHGHGIQTFYTAIIVASDSEQHPNPVLSPKCLCPAAKLLVVPCGARKQSVIESLKKKTDENVLECFGQSSCSRFRDYIA